jgi:ParB-like chromosome segregation protein Spo0J
MVHFSGADGVAADTDPKGLRYMRLKDLADTTSDLFNIPLDRISIDPEFNVRFDTPELRDHIAMLRDSMLSQGYLRTRPLTVRLSADQTSATVIDGHCRFAAVKLAVEGGAEIRNLPCVAEGKGVSRVDRDLMLLTANSGLPLAPLEQAEVVKRLLSYGWTEAMIGGKIGRTRQHIANLLELAGAPPGVKVMVANGVVSATEAVKTIRSQGDGATKTLQAAAEVAKAKGKGKVTASSIAAVTDPKPKATPPAPPPVPRVVQRAVVPLQTAARYVVDAAKGLALPADLRRAIDALHESLT